MKDKFENIEHCLLCGSNNIFTFKHHETLRKCLDCGYIFDSPRPTFEAISEFYSNSSNYYNWLKRLPGLKKANKKRVLKIKKYISSGKMLDVGAGIGVFLNEAKQYGFEVTGTEISELGIKKANEWFNISLIKGRIEDVALQKNSYDVITMIHILEHVPDPQAVITEVSGLLKPKGILMIAVPNEIHSCVRRPLKRLLSFLRIGKFKYYGKYGLPSLKHYDKIKEIHLSHFTEKSLENFLKQNNFQILETSLDPYSTNMGLLGVLHAFLYQFFSIIKSITNRNFYDSILIIAQKK